MKKLDTPWIGLHFDFGNSMMAWEDPAQAAMKMAPYTITTHFKDHIVIPCPERSLRICDMQEFPLAKEIWI